MASAKKDRNIIVQIAKNFKNIDIYPSKLKKLVKITCNRFKLSKATISIAIVDDTEIRKMNKKFLNRNRTTDVISFDLSDKNRKSKIENRKLFELVVNGEMAVRQAKLRGHSSEAELALYITHGLLHNLGFDDSTKKQAEKMHNTEDQILQQLGYGLIYNSAKK
jgi:probable rRNA maturation factor